VADQATGALAQAQLELASAQLTLETAEQQEALSLVQLYDALGGGW
jgi:outer membrane protein TolC